MSKILTLIQDKNGDYSAHIGVYSNNYSLSNSFKQDRKYNYITQSSARRFANLILANNPEFDNSYFNMSLVGIIEY